MSAGFAPASWPKAGIYNGLPVPEINPTLTTYERKVSAVPIPVPMSAIRASGKEEAGYGTGKVSSLLPDAARARMPTNTQVLREQRVNAFVGKLLNVPCNRGFITLHVHGNV